MSTQFIRDYIQEQYAKLDRTAEIHFRDSQSCLKVPVVFLCSYNSGLLFHVDFNSSGHFHLNVPYNSLIQHHINSAVH
jgi:hypothetical protein